MKKLLTTAALLSTLSLSAQADMLVGGDVEVNAWFPTLSLNGSEVGAISDPAIIAEASFEHGVPLIPNIKVSTTNLSDSGLEYSKLDAIAYYEFLDNDLASFDLGVGGSKIEFSGQAPGFDIGSPSGTLLTLYGQGEVGIPATPIFGYVKAYVSGDTDTTVRDVSIGFQYEIGLVALDMELQVGYRMQELDLKDFDGATAKVDLEGVFAGVNLDF